MTDADGITPKNGKTAVANACCVHLQQPLFVCFCSLRRQGRAVRRQLLVWGISSGLMT